MDRPAGTERLRVELLGHFRVLRLGLEVARDAIFLSTLACVPVRVLIALLFTR